MPLADDIADKLAADVIAYVEKTGDEDMVTKMGQVLGDSSQTLQEAYVTSVRVQRAAIRARRMLAERLAAFDEGGSPAPPEPAPVAMPDPEPIDPETPPEPVEEEAAPEPDQRPAASEPAKRKPPVPTVGGPRFG